MPHRYLFAHDGPRRLSVSLFRFPLGVTLEDAPEGSVILGRAWRLVLSPEARSRLEDLGVARVASGVGGRFTRWAASKRLTVDPGAAVEEYAEEYLDLNSRLGPRRLLSVIEYAMDTSVALAGGARRRLEIALYDWLRGARDVTMFGVVAVRAADARRHGFPLHLRADNALWAAGDAHKPLPRVPCRLHNRECAVPRNVRVGMFVAWFLVRIMSGKGYSARVPVTPGEPLRTIARRLLDTLPLDCWRNAWPSARVTMSHVLAWLYAETCEEAAALQIALESCRSVREMIDRARARDAAWVASRVLLDADGQRHW